MEVLREGLGLAQQYERGNAGQWQRFRNIGHTIIFYIVRDKLALQYNRYSALFLQSTLSYCIRYYDYV